jgi:hypothetical protein
MVPAGLLLAADGLMELHWWGTPQAAQLRAVMAQTKDQYGTDPPALLRGHGGAVLMIVVGAVCLGFAILAPLIAQGRRSAHGWGLTVGGATFLVGLIGIGTDMAQPHDLNGYYTTLTQLSLDDHVRQVRGLLYPGWYSWLEDAAQGLQVLASLAVVLALLGMTIWYADHFIGRPAEDAADPWDATVRRIHEQTVRGSRPVNDET